MLENLDLQFLNDKKATFAWSAGSATLKRTSLLRGRGLAHSLD